MSTHDCGSFVPWALPAAVSDRGAECASHSLPRRTGTQAAPGMEVSTQSLGFQTRCSAAKALVDDASDLVWQVGLRCPKIHHFKSQTHF